MKHKSGKQLHPIASELGQKYAKPLLAIEGSRHIMITSKASEYRIELDRWDLSFMVNKEQCLECSGQDAVVHDKRDIGTFFGLKTFLVLITKNGDLSILLPYGEVVASSLAHHVEVKIMSVEPIQ